MHWEPKIHHLLAVGWLCPNLLGKKKQNVKPNVNFRNFIAYGDIICPVTFCNSFCYSESFRKRWREWEINSRNFCNQIECYANSLLNTWNYLTMAQNLLTKYVVWKWFRFVRAVFGCKRIRLFARLCTPRKMVIALNCIRPHKKKEHREKEKEKRKTSQPHTHTHSKCSTYDPRVHANGIHSTKGGNQIQLKSSHFKQTIITSFFFLPALYSCRFKWIEKPTLNSFTRCISKIA